jgi:beta-hydroxyacyl-ACP dehydratase FabZ
MSERAQERVLGPDEVMQILPHRYPFLMVDKLIEIYEGSAPPSRMGRKAVAVKNVSLNEPFFSGHFPGRPVMPGVLIIEAMAQAGCLAYYRKNDEKMEVAIASIRAAKFRRPVVPGDVLKLTAEVVKDRGEMLVLQCTAHVGSELAAEAEILAVVRFKPRTNS